MTRPRAHIRLDLSAGCSIGPGKIELLECIDRSGSLSAAARLLGMSYRRAWLLLHSLNESLQQPAVELSAGGRDGGGAALTESGRALVADYRRFESDVGALAVETFGHLRTSGAGSGTGSRSRRPVRRVVRAKR